MQRHVPARSREGDVTEVGKLLVVQKKGCLGKAPQKDRGNKPAAKWQRRFNEPTVTPRLQGHAGGYC